ncbi:serine/threonine protein kinase [Nocardiopsis valliformis]|uniref:serine/threonine protein kinase n=1 Tax=Nocardiopsis valliformis TaxID=239974 RepID=UPI00034947C5|nr:serine/threonine-protein kinase [Nocardiopsis valliformis]
MGETSGQHTEVGGYRLIREIGRGGFGTVHLAEAPDGSRAAVKLLHLSPDTDLRFATMFATEVDAARRISPFCIAQVLDADPHAEQPWIASEYIEGRTLAEEVRADGPRTGADLQRLAVSTSTALTAIHRAGIVHRDLKPENIMMAPDGPRVIDFGIARAFEETARFTATARIGTLPYMAPERLDDTPHLTPAVDVFAWGAVIAYAASGRHAFSGSRQTAVIKRILMDEPDCSGVPDELRGLVTRCLSKDPEQRPTAHQVLNILLGQTEESADVDTALTQGNLKATRELTTEAQGLPPTRKETSKVLREEVTPVPDPELLQPPPAPTTPPYHFAGRLHHSVGELAESMQAKPSTAAEVFANRDERAALASWIIEDLGETRIDRSLLRKQPKNARMAVLLFVSQARPDLPPRYGDIDLSLSALHEAPDQPGVPLVSPIPLAGFRNNTLEVMEVMAAHKCQNSEHLCPAGEGCAQYRRLIEDVREAQRAYKTESLPYIRWTEEHHPHGDWEQDWTSHFEASEITFIFYTLSEQQAEQQSNELHGLINEQWKQALPTEPTPDMPVSERVSRNLVISALCQTLSEVVTSDKRLSNRRKVLEEFVPARREANKIIGNHGWDYGFVVAVATFALVIVVGADPSQEPRIDLALPSALVVFSVIVGIKKSTTDNAVNVLLKDITDPFKHVRNPKEKLEKATQTLEKVMKEIRVMEKAREELARISRNR